MFDGLIASGTSNSDMQSVITALGTLSTAQQVSDAVRQTLPLMTGGGAMATNNVLHSMNRIIQSRVENNRGLSSGDEFYGNRQIWLKPFGSHAKQQDRDAVAGFKLHTGGLALGVDNVVNDKVRVGGVLTYADSDVTSNDPVAAQKTDVKTIELVGYASYNLDPTTDLNYQIDVGRNTNQGHRNINFGALSRIADSDYDSLSAHISAGIGHLIGLDAATNVTPSLRLDYTHVKTDGYTETGAGALNLKVDSSTYREMLVSGDVKLARELNSQLKLVSNVSLAYDLINKTAVSSSAFVGGGAVFVTNGLKPSPWLGRLGLGLVSATESGKEWTLRYDLEKRTSGFLGQTLSARLRMPF